MLRRLFGQTEKTQDDSKLEASLEKTRSGFMGRIGSIFQANEITEELWEELEEALIMGDVGMAVTTKLVEQTRARGHPRSLRDQGGHRDLAPVLEQVGRRGLLHALGRLHRVVNAHQPLYGIGGVRCEAREDARHLVAVVVRLAHGADGNRHHRDEGLVGRVRRDPVSERLWLWEVSDNPRKGAATNAVQIAEEMLARRLL